MLRGVNKSIIEVLETENQYFEKAILFVRPGHSEGDEGVLKTKAREYLAGINYKPSAGRLKKPLVYSALKLGSAAALGATAATILLRM